MALFDSEKSMLYLAQYDLRAYTTEFRGLPGGRGLNQAATFGDAGQRHHPTIQDVTMNASFFWDNTAIIGIDEVFGGLRAEPIGFPVSYFEEGDTFEALGYVAGLAAIENFEIATRVGNLVEADAVMRVHGKSQRMQSLFPKTTVTATTNGTGHDDLASGSGAEVAMIFHATAVSATGGNAQWKVRIEDDDNSGFTSPNVVKEVLVADGVPAGLYVVAATSLQRYHRVVIERDATSGSITVQVSYIPITGNDDWS